MRLLLAGCLLGAVLAACGGSSSETPWPAEPENAALGPAGESPSGGGALSDAGPPPRPPRPEERAPQPL